MLDRASPGQDGGRRGGLPRPPLVLGAVTTSVLIAVAVWEARSFASGPRRE